MQTLSSHTRGGGLRPLSALFVPALACVLALAPGRLAADDYVEALFELVLPDPELSGDRTVSTVLPPVDLGTINMGEYSALNAADFAGGRIRIRIRSGSFYFPPYRLWARVLTPNDPTPGNFNAFDIGMGVQRIQAGAHVVNPDYDYDPATVLKDIDEVPIFLGTVGSLGFSPPYTELYHTTEFRVGRNNRFDLVFAVGPQFFSVDSLEGVVIEIGVTI